MLCINCGKENADESKFCTSCGKELIHSDIRFCPGCGNKIKTANINFCEKCGLLLRMSPIQNNFIAGSPPISNLAPVENQINVMPSATDIVVGSVLADTVYNEDLKSANIAAILCMVLGWYGAHDFYCSKIHSAVIKLILGLTGVGLIATVPWALMDLWSIWKGEYVDGYGQKLAGKATILVVLFVIIIAIIAFCIFFQFFYEQERLARGN